jgi:hypothetical protein
MENSIHPRILEIIKDNLLTNEQYCKAILLNLPSVRRLYYPMSIYNSTRNIYKHIHIESGYVMLFFIKDLRDSGII